MDPSPRRSKVEKEARIAETTRRDEPVLDPELLEDEPQRVVVQALARVRRPQPVVRLRGEVVDSDPRGRLHGVGWSASSRIVVVPSQRVGAPRVEPHAVDGADAVDAVGANRVAELEQLASLLMYRVG